jgi:O-antigen/teichoic acid export membrane protein
MLSFALVGLTGILINIMVVREKGEEVFGVFNQVYAIFLMLSQLAAGGVHLSVQRFIPLYARREKIRSQILFSALGIGSMVSIVVVFLAWLLHDAVGFLLKSDAVEQGYLFAIPGLLFFTLNKILISYHNGLQNFRIFAILQFMRMGLLFLFVFLFLHYNNDSAMLCSSFSLTEGTLFLVSALSSIPYLKLPARDASMRKWLGINFSYGNKAFVGNFLLDINTKADVFILGIFFDDASVGIYSFASTFAEGFMQLAAVLRNIFNPLLARLRFIKKTKKVSMIIRKFRRSTFMLVNGAACFAILVFPFILKLFSIQENNNTYWLIFSLLTGCYALTSGYQTLLMIFNQYGKPSLQTRFVFFVFLSNVLLNLIIVPYAGITGAAIATALSFFVQVGIQRYLMQKVLHLSTF